MITIRVWQHSLCVQPHAVQVDVSEEEDQFQAVTTACLNVLILAVETRLDVALQQMTRMPWATLETVSPACCSSAGSLSPCKCLSMPMFCPQVLSSSVPSKLCQYVLPSYFPIARHLSCSVVSATCLCSAQIDTARVILVPKVYRTQYAVLHNLLHQRFLHILCVNHSFWAIVTPVTGRLRTTSSLHRA